MVYIIVHKNFFGGLSIDKIYNQLDDVFFFWNNYVNLENMFKYAIITNEGNYLLLESFIIDKRINKLFWAYNRKMAKSRVF